MRVMSECFIFRSHRNSGFHRHIKQSLHSKLHPKSWALISIRAVEIINFVCILKGELRVMYKLSLYWKHIKYSKYRVQVFRIQIQECKITHEERPVTYVFLEFLTKMKVVRHLIRPLMIFFPGCNAQGLGSYSKKT